MWVIIYEVSLGLLLTDMNRVSLYVYYVHVLQTGVGKALIT